MSDYIPAADAELIEFADNFISKIDGLETSFGLVATDTDALTALRDTFNAAYAANNTAQTAAQTARTQKDADKKPLVAKLRDLAQDVQETNSVTDAQRMSLGLNVRQAPAPTGPPTSRPVVEVDTSQPLQHTVKFYDNEMETKGKPEGVKGAEIWCKVGGEATMNEDDYRYLGTDTATPYLAVHKPENVGKQAHYLLRWVNSKGEWGAWSNTASATITG